MKTKKLSRVDALGDLLGTRDANEQAARVKHLLQLAQTQPPTIVIQLNRTTGRASVNTIGQDLPINVVYGLLDAARHELIQQELEMKQRQEATAEQPPAA